MILSASLCYFAEYLLVVTELRLILNRRLRSSSSLGGGVSTVTPCRSAPVRSMPFLWVSVLVLNSARALPGKYEIMLLFGRLCWFCSDEALHVILPFASCRIKSVWAWWMFCRHLQSLPHPSCPAYRCLPSLPTEPWKGIVCILSKTYAWSTSRFLNFPPGSVAGCAL